MTKHHLIAMVPAAAILALGLTAAPAAADAAVVAVSATAAAARPACHASMTNARPRDYTSTGVRVRTAAKAWIRTIAHYKTTNHTKHGRAGIHGRATIWYYISGATPGYKVVVSVRVRHDGRLRTCQTSFTPRS